MKRRQQKRKNLKYYVKSLLIKGGSCLISWQKHHKKANKRKNRIRLFWMICKRNWRNISKIVKG